MCTKKIIGPHLLPISSVYTYIHICVYIYIHIYTYTYMYMFKYCRTYFGTPWSPQLGPSHVGRLRGPGARPAPVPHAHAQWRPQKVTRHGRLGRGQLSSPEGPSTQYLRPLVPNTIKSMVFGTRVLKCWVLGPSGQGFQKALG